MTTTTDCISTSQTSGLRGREGDEHRCSNHDGDFCHGSSGHAMVEGAMALLRQPQKLGSQRPAYARLQLTKATDVVCLL